MPNVIIIKDVGVQGPPGPSGSGFPYTGSAIISGSLVVSGSIVATGGYTGSLLGTSSYANQSNSSSYAVTASYAIFAENGGEGGSGGFSFATITEQLNTFAGIYLENSTQTTIITGSINSPLTYTGEYQLFEIINVSRQLGLTLSTYGDVNMTASLNINEDVDLTPGTYFSAPSGTYFSSITFGTTVGNQSIKVYNKVQQPPLLTDGLFTTSSVIVANNLYVYKSLEVFGGITGSLQGTASHAKTASYAMFVENQPNGFPFSGSAVITGSVVAGNENFTVENNKVEYNQTSSISNTTITIKPKSNLVDETYISSNLGENWQVSPSEIFIGTLVELTVIGVFGSDALLGTRVFYTGSTDVFNVEGFRYIGNVESRTVDYDDGLEDYVTSIGIRSVTATTLSPTENPPFTSLETVRFYPLSGSGLISLQGYTTVTKNLVVEGKGTYKQGLGVTGSMKISGSTYIDGLISASRYEGYGGNLQGVVSNPMTENLVVSASLYVTGSVNIEGKNIVNIGTSNFLTKSITLGKVELPIEQGSVDTRYDSNIINLTRNLGIVDEDSIHTRINFNGRYWTYNPGTETYDAFADANNHFLQVVSGFSSSGNIVYNRFVDLQFQTSPTGSTVSKGFSTSYNAESYFNITGSVSASTYYGEGNELERLYESPIVFDVKTGSFTVSTADLGRMVEVSGSSNIDILVPDNSELICKTGSQFTYITTGTQTTNFITGSGVTLLSSLGKTQFYGQYSVISLVKRLDNTFYLFGGLN